MPPTPAPDLLQAHVLVVQQPLTNNATIAIQLVRFDCGSPIIGRIRQACALAMGRVRPQDGESPGERAILEGDPLPVRLAAGKFDSTAALGVVERG